MKYTLNKETREKLYKLLKLSKVLGKFRTVVRINVVLSLFERIPIESIAIVHNVCVESIKTWFTTFLAKGVDGLESKKSPGRPSKLTETQKEELRATIIAGPEAAGFLGGCWRTPMIRDIIVKKYGKDFSVKYISEMLYKMGLSYQKAKFGVDHKNPETREEWLNETWVKILTEAKQRNSMITFGDEVSFPQWGSLTYTWAPIGVQPVINTSGVRKGYKVFGLIDYFTGDLFYKGQESKFNSESYMDFITSVLEQSDKHLILIQDGARYHTSKAMVEFFAKHKERITVYQLPTYSPDYNPIEKLWKMIKQDGIHLLYFPTFEDLVKKVNQILPAYKNASAKVLPLFGRYKDLENEMMLNLA